MSEYEMAALHTELFDSVQSSVTVMLTVLSGFLLVSFFAAHRLDRLSALVGLTAFAGYATLNIVGTAGLLITYARLSHKMQAFAAGGRGLEWHNTAHAPAWIVNTLSPALLVAGVVIVLAAIRFFFHCRRSNRLKEASA